MADPKLSKRWVSWAPTGSIPRRLREWLEPVDGSSSEVKIHIGIAGVVLVVVGALIGGAGWILAVVGLVPLLAGAVDVCVLAPLMGKAFSGKKFRADADIS